ncbi:MAG TPA: thiamine phosphate synthase [Gemmatimonadales bacterium]|nr:thiamine phosphate synthase [Gemmatimonadales bacterium]
MAPNVAALVRLMLVTDDRLVAGRDLIALAREAEAGGATSVQLRLKAAPARDQVALARALVAALHIPLLINDRPDIALAAGAAGVHLGADDLPVHLVRPIVHEDFVIGASVGSAEEAAVAAGADYWGIGPWRQTGTKADAGTALGAAGFAALVRLGRGRPCLAIGGVLPGDMDAIVGAGGMGAAAASGILASDDVRAAATAYAAALARSS